MTHKPWEEEPESISDSQDIRLKHRNSMVNFASSWPAHFSWPPATGTWETKWQPCQPELLRDNRKSQVGEGSPVVQTRWVIAICSDTLMTMRDFSPRIGSKPNQDGIYPAYYNTMEQHLMIRMEQNEHNDGWIQQCRTHSCGIGLWCNEYVKLLIPWCTKKCTTGLLCLFGHGNAIICH